MAIVPWGDTTSGRKVDLSIFAGIWMYSPPRCSRMDDRRLPPAWVAAAAQEARSIAKSLMNAVFTALTKKLRRAWPIAALALVLAIGQARGQSIEPFDAFLADQGHKRADIGSWVLHTGGPKVLEATAAALDLHNGQLDASWDCLKRVGNLSSASVLVVLEDVMKNRRPEPGTLGVLAAMGPGFCSELVLLQW